MNLEERRALIAHEAKVRFALAVDDFLDWADDQDVALSEAAAVVALRLAGSEYGRLTV